MRSSIATAEKRSRPVHVEASEMWLAHPFRRIRTSACRPRRAIASVSPPDEQELVRRWIEAGAEYEPHWSFVPPTAPSVPSELTTHESAHAPWCRNDVDRFILARLAEAHLRPSEPASDEALLRRVFLDLTGLPPTPAEFDAYLAPTRARTSTNAGSTSSCPRNRTSTAMPSAWPYRGSTQRRYADTCGIHKDAGRSIWPWRDWCSRYRDNMPSIGFLTEAVWPAISQSRQGQIDRPASLWMPARVRVARCVEPRYAHALA